MYANSGNNLIINHMNQYQTLLHKLDAFIRKYYLNNLIRGSLHSLALISVIWVTFVLLEHYVFTSSVSSMAFRKSLFYSFLALAGLGLSYWVIWPLLQYFRLGKVISHEKAAQIVGQHFSNVQDKLLNVLQLNQQAQAENSALLLAAINQKTVELAPVPFQKAIDLRKNRKYLRFVLPPLFIFFGLLVFSNIVQNSTGRILSNNEEFERQALFGFVPRNLDQKLLQYEDFELIVDIEEKGALPAEVFIEVDNYQFKMEKLSPTQFRYIFPKVQEDLNFRFQANGFSSKSYSMNVLEKPNLLNFQTALDFPAYTGRKDETLDNVGDLVVPAGTKVEWLFAANFTDELAVRFAGEERQEAERSGRQNFSFKRQLQADGSYKIYLSNAKLPMGDSLNYSITVIPDLYPQIEMEKFADSTDSKLMYFAGSASDDYGLNSLAFHYTIERDGKILRQEVEPLPIRSNKQTTYRYTLNLRNMGLEPGDKLSYYFQVWDNDGVQGSKSSKTSRMVYQMATVEEMKAQEEKNDEAIKSDLEEALAEMEKLKREIKKAKENVLQKNELNWQDRREIEKLIQQQKETQEKIQNAEQNFQENKEQQEQYQKADEELLKKQEMIEKLFEEVMSDEMKELFEKMEEMLDKMDKKEVLEQLENMEMNEEEVKDELDRMLSLFKKMELEKEMIDAKEELEQLAEEQEKLAEETEQKDGDQQSAEEQKELEEKQEEINEKFEEIQDKMDKAKEKNEELDQPMEMDNEDLKEQKKEAQENLQNSSQQLKKKQNKQAAKSQKSAAKKMKEMAKEMGEMMGEGQMKQMEQDLKAMRQLLENLVDLSFDQEALIDEVQATLPNTPKYVKLVQKQYKIKDDFKQVEDSLQALAKRVYQLESFITEKVNDTKKTLNKGIDLLEERQKRPAMVQQQYSMTYINDLALMLSESMNQMQQQMAGEMAGEQMCEKPGGKGKPGSSGKGKGQDGDQPNMGGMKEMQKGLQEQLKKLEQMMKNGQSPSSKQFAEMAAKQAAIRKAMEKMKRELQQKGKGGGKELQDIIDQMDKVETDLVNKRLPSDINKRQQDILTRMLEHEKAQREREYDDQRRAERPNEDLPKNMPPAMQEYLKEREGQVELFRTVSPNLKPYYKKRVEGYFRALR